jgi:Holliday junction resolvasome RuvABC DNA-binding subunit
LLAREALKALETLGFSTVEARNAVTTAQKENLTIKTVEELLQYSLKSRK